MPPLRPQPLALSRITCVLAWFLAGLVVMLSLLTVSPSLHAHLHHEAGAHDHDNNHDTAAAHDDLGCAVTLYQQGLTAPLALPQLETPHCTLGIATLPPARDTLALSAPPHRLRPARGPPDLG